MLPKLMNYMRSLLVTVLMEGVGGVDYELEIDGVGVGDGVGVTGPVNKDTDGNHRTNGHCATLYAQRTEEGHFVLTQDQPPPHTAHILSRLY